MFGSVRARLTALYTALLGLLLTLFALLGYALLAHALQQTADRSLAETAGDFLDTWTTELRLERATNAAEVARLAARDFRYKDRTVEVFDERRMLITSSEDIAPSAALTAGAVMDALLTRSEGQDAYATLRGSAGENIRAFVARREVGGRRFAIVVFRSLRLQDDVLARMRDIFYLAIPAGLAIAALTGYFLAWKSLQPVAAITEQASGIGAGSLNQRLAVRNQNDEMGRLAIVLNDLLGRLEQSFQQQHRLLTDASHELRTPVSIIRGEAEVALSRPARTPAEYRDALAVIHDEARRMTHIVENLFTMARAEARRLPVIPGDFYLEELVSDCMRALRTPGADKSVRFFNNAEEEMPIRADEALLRRLMMNLLENALKYTPAGGRIDVDFARHDDTYMVMVRDTGSGIPPEAQPFIFEPFFRADKARSRTESTGGGAGLGLAIAQWIALVHDGKLELASSDEHGTAFRLTLPSRPPGDPEPAPA